MILAFGSESFIVKKHHNIMSCHDDLSDYGRRADIYIRVRAHEIVSLAYEIQSKIKIQSKMKIQSKIPSLYNHLVPRQCLKEVGVDDVAILLPNSPQIAIGTQQLNGCTCVIILGKAIVLAHISPLPGSSQSWEDHSVDNRKTAAMAHHNDFMDRVQTLVNENMDHFPPSTTLWGVFCYGADGIVDFTKEIVQSRLERMGYRVKTANYQEIPSEGVVHPKGQIVALRKKDVSELYVERKKVWPPSDEMTDEAAEADDDGDHEEGGENDEGHNDGELDNDESKDEDEGEEDITADRPLQQVRATNQYLLKMDRMPEQVAAIVRQMAQR